MSNLTLIIDTECSFVFFKLMKDKIVHHETPLKALFSFNNPSTKLLKDSSSYTIKKKKFSLSISYYELELHLNPATLRLLLTQYYRDCGVATIKTVLKDAKTTGGSPYSFTVVFRV